VWALLLCGSAAAQESALQADFPPELVRFVAHQGNPVFAGAGQGQWDAKIRERGWIIRDDDAYRMWYTGYDGSREGIKLLGYATSPDGLHWTRHGQRPIYADHWVEDMMIVRHRGTYYMFAEGERDQAHLLTSRDGLHWERVGPLDIRQTSGQPIPAGPYGTPTAWLENGTWHLFYERKDAGVWLAKSTDRMIWTNVQDEPVLQPGPQDYDRKLIALNQVIKHGGKYYAYYHGSSGQGQPVLWTTNVAVSDDLIHWKKYPSNPLFQVQENKSSGIVVHDGNRWRLYTMHDAVHVHFAEQ
jgi:predicted GH43/DUF377 family glycosyl hydrolase